MKAECGGAGSGRPAASTGDARDRRPNDPGVVRHVLGALVYFRDARLFAAFGLPAVLPAAAE
jgi:hypothetical protein